MEFIRQAVSLNHRVELQNRLRGGNSPLWQLIFQAEKRRIQEEANRKRAEAAREQPRTEMGVFQPVVEQSVPQPERHKSKPAKAAASKTNPGAVARGDKLVKERPDLTDQVRKGEIKPAEAHRQMKPEKVVRQSVGSPSESCPVG